MKKITCLVCLNTIPECTCASDKALMAALGFKNAKLGVLTEKDKQDYLKSTTNIDAPIKTSPTYSKKSKNGGIPLSGYAKLKNKEYSLKDFEKFMEINKKVAAMATKPPIKFPKQKTLIAFHSYGGSNVLKCPHCEGYNLKQTSVTVYERATDSAPIGTAVTVNKEGVFNTEHLTGNPSPRKNAVVILFKCVDCDHEYDLSIAYLKGATDFQLKPHKN